MPSILKCASGPCRASSRLRLPYRYRANVAHIRQSMLDSGLGFQVKELEKFQPFPSSF